MYNANLKKVRDKLLSDISAEEQKRYDAQFALHGLRHQLRIVDKKMARPDYMGEMEE